MEDLTKFYLELKKIEKNIYEILEKGGTIKIRKNKNNFIFQQELVKKIK